VDKSSIARAIRAGRLKASKDEFGMYAIPADQTLNLRYAQHRQQQRRPDHKSNWERVDHSTAFTSQGDTRVTTWRLRVQNGWLYKVTEWDDENHFVVQVCFAADLGVRT
jgi:hypothetical protein